MGSGLLIHRLHAIHCGAVLSQFLHTYPQRTGGWFRRWSVVVRQMHLLDGGCGSVQQFGGKQAADRGRDGAVLRALLRVLPNGASLGQPHFVDGSAI